jgi:hypothetical protein
LCPIVDAKQLRKGGFTGADHRLEQDVVPSASTETGASARTAMHKLRAIDFICHLFFELEAVKLDDILFERRCFAAWEFLVP